MKTFKTMMNESVLSKSEFSSLEKIETTLEKAKKDLDKLITKVGKSSIKGSEQDRDSFAVVLRDLNTAKEGLAATFIGLYASKY